MQLGMSQGIHAVGNEPGHTPYMQWECQGIHAVQASGHTFAPGVEAFLPKVAFEAESLVFPAAMPGCPVYRTAVMKNTGDTPLLFDLSHDPTGYMIHS